MQSLLVVFLALFAQTFAAISSGCTPDSVNGNGFLVDFYKYPVADALGWASDFFSSAYKKFGYLKSAQGVTTSDFAVQNNVAKYTVVNGKIYGQDITTTNYSMELSGYFRATQSGTYTFTLNADNGASLQFGSGQTCCNDASGSVTGNFSIQTLGPAGGGGSVDVNTYTASFTLQEGIYYPVKIVTFNWIQNGGLRTTWKTPDGTVHKDIASEVWQLTFEDSVCYTTTTTLWNNPYTSTTTIDGGATDTVVVGVPKATVTVTNTWGSHYTTTTTGYGKSTNTVVIDVPTPTTTTTSLWSGTTTTTTLIKAPRGGTNTLVFQIPKQTTATTSTWGSSFATTTTASGTSTDTVHVNVPTPTNTITTHWTGTYTTTTTITGEPGGNNTVLVEIPKSVTSLTSTYSGSVTTTTTITGSVTDTVVIEVPTQTETITSYWTGTYTTTETITGGPGHNNTLVVEIPKSVETLTSTYSGSVTTTTTITGTATNTVVVEVPTPTTTVTTHWTGDYTTTTTITGGQTNTVLVEIPTSRAPLSSATSSATSAPAPFSSGGWNSSYVPSTVASSTFLELLSSTAISFQTPESQTTEASTEATTGASTEASTGASTGASTQASTEEKTETPVPAVTETPAVTKTSVVVETPAVTETSVETAVGTETVGTETPVAPKTSGAPATEPAQSASKPSEIPEVPVGSTTTLVETYVETAQGTTTLPSEPEAAETAPAVSPEIVPDVDLTVTQVVQITSTYAAPSSEATSWSVASATPEIYEGAGHKSTVACLLAILPVVAWAL